jgi:hypothetical protein
MTGPLGIRKGWISGGLLALITVPAHLVLGAERMFLRLRFNETAAATRASAWMPPDDAKLSGRDFG